MNTTRGFVSMGLILVLIIAAAALGGSAYYANNQSLVFHPIIPAVETASTTPPNNPITCKAGQHSNGVTCVPDSNNCPIYNACPPGYTSKTSVDANGCTKLQCTAPTSTTPPKVCTQEAKLCSDGSYVGRTGPNCEFAACPQ